MPAEGPRVEDLLAPDDSMSLRCGEWRLSGMTAGPACEATLHFESAERERPLDVRFRVEAPPTTWIPPAIVVDSVPHGGAPAALLDCVRERLDANNAQERLPELCLFPGPEDTTTAPNRGSVREATMAPPPGHQDVPTAREIAWLLAFFFIGMLSLGLLRWTGRRTSTERSPQSPSVLRDPVLLGIIAGGLLLRVWLFHVLAPEIFEFEDLVGRGLIQQLREIATGGRPGAAITWNNYHAPLTGLLGGVFRLLLGEAGIDNMIYLRSLNLGLFAANCVLVIRLGRCLGAPMAGRVAASLLAFLPAFAVIGARFAPYPVEMTFALLFLDRVLPPLLEPGQEPTMGIGIAATLLLWTSYLSALLVAPTLLILVLRAPQGRTRARALGLIGATLLLAAPILGRAFFAAVNLVAATHSSSFAGIDAIIGDGVHPAFSGAPGGLSALLLPLRLLSVTVGIPGAVVVVGGWLLLWRTRLRGLLVASAVIMILFVAVDACMFTRWFNYLAVLPMMLLLGVAGWELRPLIPLRARWLVIGSLALCSLAPMTTLLWQTSQVPPDILASWACGRSTWFTIVDRVHQPDARERPLLVSDPDRLLNLHHLACGGDGTVTALGSCPSPRTMEVIEHATEMRCAGGFIIIAAARDEAQPEPPPEPCVFVLGTPRVRLHACPAQETGGSNRGR